MKKRRRAVDDEQYFESNAYFKKQPTNVVNDLLQWFSGDSSTIVTRFVSFGTLGVCFKQ